MSTRSSSGEEIMSLDGEEEEEEATLPPIEHKFLKLFKYSLRALLRSLRSLFRLFHRQQAHGTGVGPGTDRRPFIFAVVDSCGERPNELSHGL